MDERGRTRPAGAIAGRVGVGSGNPVKRRAVESALPDAAVEAIPVGSGVSEQPFGHAETIAGAENRARAVLEAGAYDLGVGVEGGVAEFPSAARRRESDGVAELDGTADLYLVMWAAVTDGELVGRGAGPSVPLPDSIAERLRAGEELGPVMDDVLGEDDVAKKQGAAGALTAGRVDREAALTVAVAGALGPFVCDLY
jgi:inosine/xanthosine triphosphatase